MAPLNSSGSTTPTILTESILVGLHKLRPRLCCQHSHNISIQRYHSRCFNRYAQLYGNCDIFCSSLMKRAVRPDTESEDDVSPNESSYQIQRG